MSDDVAREVGNNLFSKFSAQAGLPIFRRIKIHLHTSDDAFSIIIKGKVIIDELIDIGIRTRAPILDDFKKLVRDDFNSRWTIFSHLYQDSAVVKSISESLRMLNKLRKDYAHSLDLPEEKASAGLQGFVKEVKRALRLEALTTEGLTEQVRECILLLSIMMGSTVYGAQLLTIGNAEKDIYGNPIVP